jgi:hypothetical protein
MRGVVTTLVLLAALVPSATSAMPTPNPPIALQEPVGDTASSQGISASLSTKRAGARPVTVTLMLRYAMRCGRPGPGSLVVTFPDSERMASRISPAAILLNGQKTRSVKRSGKEVTIAFPATSGMTCNVIGPGALKVVFTRAAQLGNPMQAGSYALVARTKNVVLRTRIQITSD